MTETDRRCEVCEKSIPPRPYQASTVRACSPTCAKVLAASEHPDIDPSWRSRRADSVVVPIEPIRSKV
jgi:hypothetical protein